MVNKTANDTSTTITGTEIYATLLCCLGVFFNSFVAWILWKIDILHLILIEMICLNIGTLMGVVVFELVPEVYHLVELGVLDYISVTIVFTIGWGLPLTIEKLLKRGKGNKYKRLMQTTGMDNTNPAGPKSLRTVVKEKLEQKEKAAANKIANAQRKAAKGQADAERSVSLPVDEEKALTGETADANAAEGIEMTAPNAAADAEGNDDATETSAVGTFNIAIHDDDGSSAETVVIDPQNSTTTVTKRPVAETQKAQRPNLTIKTTSSTSKIETSANSSNSSNSMATPNSSALAKFDVDDANLSPRSKEIEKDIEGDEDEAEELARKVAAGEDVTLIIIMLMGDMIHNFVDGGVMASAFHVNTSVGIATFIGIFLEEIPHLTSTFAVFVQAGAPIWKALVLNAIGATPFLFGAGIILGVLSSASTNHNDVNYLIPFACGSFLYVSLTDLVPIISMYWHGWIRAASHLLSVGCGLIIQAGIKVYGNSEGSLG